MRRHMCRPPPPSPQPPPPRLLAPYRHHPHLLFCAVLSHAVALRCRAHLECSHALAVAACCLTRARAGVSSSRRPTCQCSRVCGSGCRATTSQRCVHTSAVSARSPRQRTSVHLCARSARRCLVILTTGACCGRPAAARLVRAMPAWEVTAASPPRPSSHQQNECRNACAICMCTCICCALFFSQPALHSAALCTITAWFDAR